MNRRAARIARRLQHHVYQDLRAELEAVARGGKPSECVHELLEAWHPKAYLLLRLIPLLKDF